jgi:hypothetical protein
MMKTQYIIISFAALLLAKTVAATPLLEKVTTHGYVMAEYALNKSCVIENTGQMTIYYNLRGLSSQRVVKLKLNRKNLNAVIDTAALGTLKKAPGEMVDAGRTDHFAYQKQADGTFKKVILWQSGDGVIYTNQSPEAKLLRNFIDLNCGDPLLY